MGKHSKGLVVTFKSEVSDEYAEKVAAAIRLMHHVADVATVPEDINDYMNRQQVKHELYKEIREVFYPEKK